MVLIDGVDTYAAFVEQFKPYQLDTACDDINSIFGHNTSKYLGTGKLIKSRHVHSHYCPSETFF